MAQTGKYRNQFCGGKVKKMETLACLGQEK